MLKYLGGGFIVGVPARDLTDDEAKQFDRAALIQSKLYAEERPAKQKNVPASLPGKEDS